MIYLVSSMECYRFVIQGSNNVVTQHGDPGAKGNLGTLKVLAEHPLNSSDQGQSIRSGHLKHVSSFRGAPNDILIWKITNNLTPTTSLATSQGMCSVVDLREPLINTVALKCLVRGGLDSGDYFWCFQRHTLYKCIAPIEHRSVSIHGMYTWPPI